MRNKWSFGCCCVDCACAGWPDSAPNLTATLVASTCSGVHGVSWTLTKITALDGECLRWDGTGTTGYSCTGGNPVNNIRIIARVLSGGTEIESQFVPATSGCTWIGSGAFTSPDTFVCSPLAATWNQGAFTLQDDTAFGTCDCCTGTSGTVGYTLT